MFDIKQFLAENRVILAEARSKSYWDAMGGVVQAVEDLQRTIVVQSPQPKWAEPQKRPRGETAPPQERQAVDALDHFAASVRALIADWKRLTRKDIGA